MTGSMTARDTDRRMTARPRIYAAHPQTSYKTDHADRRLAALARLLPPSRFEIIDPEDAAWPTDAAWRRDWSEILDGLTGLVVFSADDGTIGSGCLRELGDAIAAGLPVAGLDDDGLHEIEGVSFETVQWRTARRVGALVLGKLLDAGELFPVGVLS